VPYQDGKCQEAHLTEIKGVGLKDEDYKTTIDEMMVFGGVEGKSENYKKGKEWLRFNSGSTSCLETFRHPRNRKNFFECIQKRKRETPSFLIAGIVLGLIDIILGGILFKLSMLTLMPFVILISIFTLSVCLAIVGITKPFAQADQELITIQTINGPITIKTDLRFENRDGQQPTDLNEPNTLEIVPPDLVVPR